MNFLKYSLLLSTSLLLGTQSTCAMDPDAETIGTGIHTSEKTVLHVIDDTVTYTKRNFKTHKDENKNCLFTKANKPSKLPVQPQAILIYKGQPRQIPIEEKILMRVKPGQDGRTQITNTTGWPNPIHAQLTMEYPGGDYGGSGILIGPQHLLTAAHNVYNYGRQEWAKTISVRLGLNETAAPFGEIKVVRVYTFKSYIQSNDPNYDMALLILDSSIGHKIGWCGLLSLDDANLSRKKVTITGYPGDHGFNKLMTMSHRVKSLEKERFYYDIDTYGGQSGSGIWIKRKNKPYIIGIHTLGEDVEYTGNSGVRLSPKKFKKITKWVSMNFILLPPNPVKIDEDKEDWPPKDCCDLGPALSSIVYEMWYGKPTSETLKFSQPAKFSRSTAVSTPVVSQEKDAEYYYTLVGANQGSPQAQFNLGIRYEKGKGVPNDVEEAKKWYRLAADQGYEPAKIELKKYGIY